MNRICSPKEQLEQLLTSLVFDMSGPLGTVMAATSMINILLSECKTEQENIVLCVEINLETLQRLLNLMQIYLDEVNSSINSVDIPKEPSMSDAPLQVRTYVIVRVHHEFTLLEQQATSILNLIPELDQEATRASIKQLGETLLDNTTRVRTLLEKFRDKYSYIRPRTPR